MWTFLTLRKNKWNSFWGITRNTSTRITSVFLSVRPSRNICLLALLVLSPDPISCKFGICQDGLKGRQTGSHLHSFIMSALSEWICVRVTPTHITTALNITRKQQKKKITARAWISVSDQCFISLGYDVNRQKLIWNLWKEPRVTPRTAVTLGEIKKYCMAQRQPAITDNKGSITFF